MLIILQSILCTSADIKIDNNLKLVYAGIMVRTAISPS